MMRTRVVIAATLLSHHALAWHTQLIFAISIFALLTFAGGMPTAANPVLDNNAEWKAEITLSMSMEQFQKRGGDDAIAFL
jgi:hypothetical protein